MTNNTLNAILVETMNHEANEWFYDQDIYSINLVHNGTHVYDWLTQSLYYDDENGILKVKYNTSNLVSSPFDSASVSLGTVNVSIKLNAVGRYSSAFLTGFPTLKPFRNPKAGDIFYAVDRNTFEIVDVAKISSMSSNGLVLDRVLTNIDNSEIFAYASGNVLELVDGDIQSKKVNTSVESLDGNNSFLIYRVPTTPYDTDIYIGANGIIGFTMKK
jgi:hypothetical protein